MFLLVPFHATDHGGSTFHQNAGEEISHAFVFLSESDLEFIERYFDFFAPVQDVIATVNMSYWVDTYPLGWEEVLESRDISSSEGEYGKVHDFLLSCLSPRGQSNRVRALLNEDFREMREALDRASSRRSLATVEMSPGPAYRTLWFNYGDKGSYAQSEPLYWDDVKRLWGELKSGQRRFFLKS
jgi:hypothetical protein